MRRRLLFNRDGRQVASLTDLRDGRRRYNRFRVDPARDLLRRWNGYAIDEAHLRQMADGDTVRLTFTNGETLSTTAGDFRRHGTLFDFQRGRQVCLSLAYWRASGEATADGAEQLAFALDMGG